MTNSQEQIDGWRVSRLGREPFGLPPEFVQGKGRFDDTRAITEYRVLYCAPEPKAAVVEVLQRFRLSLSVLREISEKGPLSVRVRDEFHKKVAAPTGLVSAEWINSRQICSGKFCLQSPLLDIFNAEVIEEVRRSLATTIMESGASDLDLSEVSRVNRELTQAISLWAWQSGYSGVRYASRFGADLVCYAFFEGRYDLGEFVHAYPLAESPGLHAAAKTLHLKIP